MRREFRAHANLPVERLADDEIIYRLLNAQADGRTHLRLALVELIERLAALIPAPRICRHRYHGVLAPNAPLRPQVTALAVASSRAMRRRPAIAAFQHDLFLG